MTLSSNDITLPTANENEPSILSPIIDDDLEHTDVIQEAAEQVPAIDTNSEVGQNFSLHYTEIDPEKLASLVDNWQNPETALKNLVNSILEKQNPSGQPFKACDLTLLSNGNVYLNNGEIEGTINIGDILGALVAPNGNLIPSSEFLAQKIVKSANFKAL